jgi:hypothetical protein
MNDDSEDADAGLVEWLSGIAGFQRR